MARVMNMEFAQRAYDFWHKSMSNIFSYRLDGFFVWKDALIIMLTGATFYTDELRTDASNMLNSYFQDQGASEDAREQSLRTAIKYISNTDNYARPCLKNREDWSK